MINEHTSFGWESHEATCANRYLAPVVAEQIRALYRGKAVRILDIGCGNGYVTAKLAAMGHTVTGVDASADGLELARAAYPGVRFILGSVYDDDLFERVGDSFDCVTSLEVVEHLFYPKRLFEQARRALRQGGFFISSTPYHGYLKNVALSLANGWDRHFSVEHDGGHIKFFSKATLARMACRSGFRNVRFRGAGRLPWLWKSVVMVAEK